jgi:predicted TIM-barrel fold metal-dependent hydrolase
MGDEDPGAFVQSLSIPETHKKKILGGNFRRLLGME